MKLKSTDIRKYATIAIAAAWLLFQSYIALVKPFHPTLQVPIHLIFALAIVYLYNPIYKKRESLKKVAWLDLIAFAGIAFLAYYYIHETLRLQNRIPYFSPLATIDVVAFFVLTILLLEAVRRTLGWNLLIFIGVFLLYAWLGQYLPRGSGLRSTGTDPMEFVELISMSSGGILGTPLTTSATYLFYFIIFGSLFSACGGGQLLIDIGLKVGKGTGGPAKAAVVSSGLLGMVSGAAVANVSTTGVMTIPMMKKVGYTPEQAGAIEAVASTGGQIMPPIMGIGAFIMAEMLGVSYGTVATAAIIPAAPPPIIATLLILLSSVLFTFFFDLPDLLLQSVHHSLQYLHPGIILIIPLNHDPRSIGGGGAHQHLIDSDLVLIPFLPVAPVLIRDLPLLFRIFLACLKAALLLILIDLHPELHDNSARIRPVLFHIVHLLISPLPLLLRTEALNPLHHDPAVPGPVKDGDMACPGQPGPEAPQIMAGFLVGLGAGDRMHLIPSGIQSFCDTLNISALACRIPALIANNHRHPLAVQTVMQLSKLALQCFQLRLVLIRLYFFIQGNLRKLRHFHQRKMILQKRNRQGMVLEGHLQGVV